MNTHQIDYKGYQISTYTEGSGEPILFLHGWPTNSRLWDAQVEALKGNYKVITLDWLGFGRSDKPRDHHYTFSSKKEILDAVIGGLLGAQEKVNIVAHDIGGPPAILWAHQQPERVKRLILLNTVLFPFSTPLDKVSHFFFHLPGIKKLQVSDWGLRILMRTLSKGRPQNSITNILQWHDNWESRIRLRTFLEPMEEGRKNELISLEAKWQELKAEKHLVVAREDPLCYAHMKKLMDNNPQQPAFTIERCGHFIPVGRPEELNAVLIEILQ